ncbi:MBL fold metallo-hydrolase [Effusibacillus pohliae]|uniref:MBL fold metallo-hydrolase n=1 Tax=Effusibacillus pohliae TaxID=232270 RepID=UPI000378ADA2|nr:MBL fold metallo-hydrolase [Effusibacillus pohliae]
MRVTRYAHRLPVSTPTLYPATTTNVYVVQDQGQALLIDAGYENPQAAKSIIQYIETLGVRQVIAIALTHHHPDHCPGAKALAECFQCPILCHPLEVQPIEEKIAPWKIGSTLQEGDTMPVGRIAVRVLHTPGHTRGHLNFWLEDEKLLLSGDNIVGEGTTWIGPPDGNLTDYLSTLRRLRDLQPTMIAPGHGDMIDNPGEKIEFFIARRLQREQQILRLLQQNPSTVAELVEAIYRQQVHPSVMWVAERTVLGHLEKLLEEKKIRQEGDRYRIV